MGKRGKWGKREKTGKNGKNGEMGMVMGRPPPQNSPIPIFPKWGNGEGWGKVLKVGMGMGGPISIPNLNSQFSLFFPVSLFPPISLIPRLPHFTFSHV